MLERGLLMGFGALVASMVACSPEAKTDKGDGAPGV